MGNHNGAGHDATHRIHTGTDGNHPGQGEEHPVHVWAQHAAQAYAPHTPYSDAGSSRNGGSNIVTVGDGNTSSVAISGNQHTTDGGGTHSTDGGGTPPTDGGGKPTKPPNPGETTQPRHRHHDINIPPYPYLGESPGGSPGGSGEFDNSPTEYALLRPRLSATPEKIPANKAGELRITF